jgi:cystathionine beta-lyase family protein involved in aluminum resistance
MENEKIQDMAVKQEKNPSIIKRIGGCAIVGIAVAGGYVIGRSHAIKNTAELLVALFNVSPELRSAYYDAILKYESLKK